MRTTTSYLLSTLSQWFFQYFFQRPRLTNPSDTRKAAFFDLFLVIATTIFFLGNSLIIGIAFFVDLPDTNNLTISKRIIITIFFTVLSILLRILLQNGYLKTSVRILAAVLIASSTLLHYINGQVPVIGILPYVISLVLAASLLSWRETLLFGFITVACLIGLVTLEKMGLFAEAGNLPDVFQPVMIVMSFTVLLTFLRLKAISRSNLTTTLEELKMEEHSELTLQLDHSAFHDPLTALPNRRLIEEKINLAIKHTAQNPQSSFAVLLFDINHFKNINDTLGHIIGDKVLIQFAKKLTSAIRATDFAGRLNGDEFIIVLNIVKDPREAMEIAERIIDALQEPFLIDNKVITISTSIGIAYNHAKDTTTSGILHNADSAMYTSKYISKEHLKSSFTIFDTAIEKKIRTTLALENDLPQAIINGEFLVYLHPIFKLDNLSLSGFEILSRWQHPTRGLINPDIYIPIAEESRTIMALDLHILEQACQQILLWKESGLIAQSVHLSANLSPKCFEEVDFTYKIRTLLTKLNFDPNYITLEITEDALMTNINLANTSLKSLKTIGIKISIDAFGTGYSSLRYLHILPIDTMKIDRFFVMAMYDTPENKKIIETIITLAKSLKLDIIATGIEELRQLDHLKSLSCDYGQGYYFTKPINIEDTELFLKTTQDNSLYTHYEHFGNSLSH